MALPMIIPAAMGLGTAILGHIGKKEAAKQARKMAAIQAKYSPWTGVAPDTSRAEKPALATDLLAGIGTGLAQYQTGQQQASQAKRAEDYLSLLRGAQKGGSSPWQGMAQATMGERGVLTDADIARMGLPREQESVMYDPSGKPIGRRVEQIMYDETGRPIGRRY